MAFAPSGKSMQDKEFADILMDAAKAEGQPMPPEDPAEYEAWFEKVTQRITQQAVEEGLVQGTNEDGTSWQMVAPQPNFVIKSTNRTSKVWGRVKGQGRKYGGV